MLLQLPLKSRYNSDPPSGRHNHYWVTTWRWYTTHINKISGAWIVSRSIIKWSASDCSAPVAPSLELLMLLSLAIVISSEVADPSSSVELFLSLLETGVIVFSYNTLPSILINLIVSSPSSETEAWPKDWSSITEGARFAQRSYPSVNGPCSDHCAKNHQRKCKSHLFQQ